MENSSVADREWIEMPAVGSSTPDDPVRPKYAVENNAVLVYRGEKVYIAFEDEDALNEAMKQPEVRRLTPNEVRKLTEVLPFPIRSLPSYQTDSDSGHLRLGDAVAWLTHKMGFQECEGCKKRRKWLNRVVIWGWWRKPGSRFSAQ